MVYKYSKYFPDTLEKGTLAFSPPLAFNDPFESFPDMTNVVESYARKLVDLGSTQADIKQNKALMQKMTHESFLRMVGETLVALCLTKIQNSILMWAHYADSHQGYVLGFDEEHEFFKKNGWKSGLRKINYLAQRPKGFTAELARSMTDEQIRAVFLTKSKEWSYESEWRMIADTQERIDWFPSRSETISLYSFPKDCLKKVTLGCHCPEETRGKVRKSLESYPDVKLYQAELDPHEFKMNIVPVTP